MSIIDTFIKALREDDTQWLKENLETIHLAIPKFSRENVDTYLLSYPPIWEQNQFIHSHIILISLNRNFIALNFSESAVLNEANAMLQNAVFRSEDSEIAIGNMILEKYNLPKIHEDNSTYSSNPAEEWPEIGDFDAEGSLTYAINGVMAMDIIYINLKRTMVDWIQ